MQSDEPALKRTQTASDAFQVVQESAKDRKKRVARSLETFFLGSYEASNFQNRDVNITSRHPSMG